MGPSVTRCQEHGAFPGELPSAQCIGYRCAPSLEIPNSPTRVTLQGWGQWQGRPHHPQGFDLDIPKVWQVRHPSTSIWAWELCRKKDQLDTAREERWGQGCPAYRKQQKESLGGNAGLWERGSPGQLVTPVALS